MTPHPPEACVAGASNLGCDDAGAWGPAAAPNGRRARSRDTDHGSMRPDHAVRDAAHATTRTTGARPWRHLSLPQVETCKKSSRLCRHDTCDPLVQGGSEGAESRSAVWRTRQSRSRCARILGYTIAAPLPGYPSSPIRSRPRTRTRHNTANGAKRCKSAQTRAASCA